jgi:hypothetical protein
LVFSFVPIRYVQAKVQSKNDDSRAADNALHNMGEALQQELLERGLNSLDATLGSEIISRVFVRSAEMTNRITLTVYEADEISKRSV